MSRISDTRQRTREAAARLVAAGRQPHQLTVDLIFAEIRQGSRTTINDELKLWKDEQARAQSLNAGLPPLLAERMLHLWQLALEQGEKTFDQRREALEGEMAASEAARQMLQQTLETLQQAHAGLENRLGETLQALEAARVSTAREASARESAQAQVQALEAALAALRQTVAEQQALQQAEHEQQVQQLQQAMQTQAAAFRAEIAQATERLESVQKHVMLQVSEAREGRKKAETLLQQATQQFATQEQQLQDAHSQLRLQTRDLERLHNTEQQLRQQLADNIQQRETLQHQLATAAGKLDAWRGQLASQEQRAREAENRLAEVLQARLDAVLRRLPTEPAMTESLPPDATPETDPPATSA